LLNTNNDLYIYGTGNFAKRIEFHLSELDYTFNGFLEFEVRHNNLSVLNPRLIDTKYKPQVILGLGNPEANIRQINRDLILLGFKTVLPVQFSQFLFEKKIDFENYWLSGDKNIFELNYKKINKTKKLFHDIKSKNLFENIIAYRRTSDLEILPEPDPIKKQYLPDDLPWLNKELPISLVDCGAFIGDTLNSFIDGGYTLKNYFGFEPDFENFNLLQKYVYEKNLSNAYLFRIATWNTNTFLDFSKSGGNNSGAHVSKFFKLNGRKVMALNLNSILNKSDVDAIKMDIEGAEIETIVGLKDIIKVRTPYLAISVYHKPQDLWEIPLLISKISHKYHFYLRVYGQQTFDTVLYCVPNKTSIKFFDF
jgi:FkbM family methyltransferase